MNQIIIIGGYYKESNYRAFGVMAATWCFATFVFVNVYCSCLTSYTSLIFQRPAINNLRDLAEKSNFLMISVVGSNAHEKLLVIYSIIPIYFHILGPYQINFDYFL